MSTGFKEHRPEADCLATWVDGEYQSISVTKDGWISLGQASETISLGPKDLPTLRLALELAERTAGTEDGVT